MSVVLNQPALALLLDAPAGPVGRDLERRAILVESASRAATSDLRQRTGNLVRSIKHEIRPAPLRAVVGCDRTIAPYAGYLEQGTGIHGIQPVRARMLASGPGHPDPLLEPQRFVNHPGNRAYGFMRRGLEAFRG